MKTRLFISLIVFLVHSSIVFGQDAGSIFKKNCGMCHTIGNGKIVGPDLKGVDKKYDMKWMIEWVKSSQTMIVKKKDPVAIKIFNDNKQMIMPDQALSDDEIKRIMAFIGEETTKLSQPVVATNTESASQKAVGETGSGSVQSNVASSSGVTSNTVIYTLLSIIVFLIIMLISLSKVIKNLAEINKD